MIYIIMLTSVPAIKKITDILRSSAIAIMSAPAIKNGERNIRRMSIATPD